MADIVLPIGRAGGAAADPQSLAELNSALPVLSLGVRAGDRELALGYIKQITRSHERRNEAVLQLEPYAGTLFPEGSGDNSAAQFQTSEYFPGERAEVVPGPVTTEQVALQRTTLYTSTLFEAVVRANGAGINNIDEDLGVNELTSGSKSLRYMNVLQQVRPVDIYEIYVSPLDGGILWGVKYLDCWFNNMNRSVNTDGNTILEDQTLEVTRTRLYSE